MAIIPFEGFCALEENAVICSQREMLPIHPVRCDSLLQTVVVAWRSFWNLNLQFQGQVWQPATDNNGCLYGLLQILKKCPRRL